LDINKFAFLYNDYEYFQWFRKNKNRTDDDLVKVLKWKRLNRMDKEKFKKILKNMWDDKNKTINMQNAQQANGVVTKAFLYHLHKPLQYPILDSNVFRAMKDIDKRNIYNTNNSINKWQRDYEQGYRMFFEELYRKNKKAIEAMKVPRLDGVEPEIVKRRILDRALWEFGRTIEKAR